MLREDIASTQEIHRAEPGESPVESWTRIDALAVVAKWTRKDPKELTHLIVMAAILLPALVILHLRRRRSLDDGLTGITGALILTSSIVSIYHQSYDALLLVAPIAGLAACKQGVWREMNPWGRVIVAGLMLTPLCNYLSTHMVLDRLGLEAMNARVLTSINGVSLAALLLVFLWIAYPKQAPSQSE